MKNWTKMMFASFMIMSTTMAVSSNNWLGGWMSLEINLISFISLMYMKLNYYTSESSMKYFIIQSMGSSIMLLGIIMSSLKMNNNSIIMLTGLMIKLGVAPFHLWVIGMMESLNWMNCLILLTWQKIATLMLMSYIINKTLTINASLSLIMGAIGGINQLSIKKIMAYSSINNMGWIIMSMMISMKLWMNYFIIYSMMLSSLIIMMMKSKINYLNQCMLTSHSPLNKLMTTSLLMSMGGLPPMLGFLPKFMTIQSMTMNNNFLMTLLMIMTSLITLYFYMQICTTMLTLNSSKLKWKLILKNNNSMMLTFMCMMNMMGFTIIMMMKSIN
uniref:NADH-ubiquinone oxidoreductase chain 2 n=2 Tax=Callitettix TaxID=533007 RepID=A0A343KGH3_9HEMI|nr:NADH dehydrogenase subunit 2 [Callitettix versicolor]ACD77277.1 NADH dehydrogenase subunit 2 [Callitettix versicolor]ATF28565.1 NADH dehydrogenase subunit 2 [Callitettix sp.EMHAU-15090607]